MARPQARHARPSGQTPSAATIQGFDASALSNPTVLLAIALMAVIVMMVLPMPTWVLDLGLALSFALAILIFTTTLFIQRPLDFSAFPTALLASLVLRLSLNVSSTKLIIGEGHTGPDAAGDVIAGFAAFIMSGDVFLGLVVFCVILIVNFMVITKGAGRMAEVSARFALDAMPGKQLAIDADMAAGAIDHTEARERRRIEQEETTFFGSLDGASKFVKGDAVAGLLITLLNFIVGMSVGLTFHDMSVDAALQTYAILTVGDGLVSQIPAVIVSIAAALLLSKGGAIGSADQALFSEFSRYPTALATVAGLMALFAFVPGMPFVPFILGASGLATLAYVTRRAATQAAEAAEAPPPAAEKPAEKSLGDLIDVEDIHLEIAPNLVETLMDPTSGLDVRIANIRKHLASGFGFILPEVRVTDDAALKPDSYVLRVFGVPVARSALRPGKVLVLLQQSTPLSIPGEDASEPVFGAPARWIDARRAEEASITGLPVVSPTDVVATHLMEIVQRNFARLFTRRAVQKLFDEFTAVTNGPRAAENKRILDEFVPDKVSLDLFQSVTRLLLDERISIRNVPLILEAIAEAKVATNAVEQIAEHVRRRLAFEFVSSLLTAEGTLPLIQLSPDWEQAFTEHQRIEADGTSDIVLPPSEFTRLAKSVGDRIASAAQLGYYPAIVTSTKRRRFVRSVLEAKGIRNPVLAFEEIDRDVQPALLGTA